MPDLLSMHPLVTAMIVIFPAYAANFSPAFFSGLLKQRWHPLDFGKRLSDGKRVLGDGKTWEGTVLGVLTGSLAGVAVHYLFPQYPLSAAVLASAGALAGDSAGSFLKRRRGFKRGEMWFPVDQLDFLAGALLFMLPVYPLGAWGILFLAFLTIAAHLSLNLLGWLFGLKSVPW